MGMNNKLMKILKKAIKPLTIVTACFMLIFSICFYIVKWGLPLSDKEVLDAAIKNEFMFKELDIRKNKYAIRNIADKGLLECYIELAKGDEKNLNTARFYRYYQNREYRGWVKKNFYYWNYKLNE